ncbi:Phospholipase/carboxylesterase [Ascobolus immersus RN42]|uniref:Acyl-protein thioesterase 1 n=1 Tax=Ascobolus immersus RN42 TaxID=1160509 RepID=A0A3N4IDZ9_ASCIM|nr:Phospholipase/carboxylesterase [Ascobolus immersus RN42]
MSTTKKLEALTIPATGEHKSTLIYLHGLGDTGHGWSSLVENFRLRSLFQHTEFIFPHAPIRPITCNGGMKMPGWYDIPEFRDLLSREDSAGLNTSRSQITSLIQAQLDKGIPASRIILGGFSQGAVTALYTGLTLPYAIGGVVCMSGYLPLRDAFKDMDRAANQGTKIFMGHGEQDMVVRYAWGVLTRDVLKGLGYEVMWRSYAGLDHSANTEEIGDLEGWLEGRIGRKGDGVV